MKTYKVVSPGKDDELVTTFHTEAKILEEYLPFWYARMDELNRNPNSFMLQHVIDDWVVCNWAEEVQKAKTVDDKNPSSTS